MDLGEQFTALENHIFAFAKSQFERNGIPPTLARIIMEAVYSRFQEISFAPDGTFTISLKAMLWAVASATSVGVEAGLRRISYTSWEACLMA